MTREVEKPIRMKKQLSDQAIALAMQGRWREALDINKNILAKFSQEVSAYNRMGRAYLELGDYARSREAYAKSVEVDPYNAIAKKNLHRLSFLKDKDKGVEDTETVEPRHFIEEIGKAGVMNLQSLAPKEVRAPIVAGDKVNLKVDGTSLIVESSQGEFLGQVEPRHALRLSKLMQSGNRYSASVVSSAEEALSVIIREIYQHPSQVGRLSFPPKGMEAVQPLAGDRVLRMGAEYEREADEESGYTIIGGEEGEVLPEEETVTAEDTVSEEE